MAGQPAEKAGLRSGDLIVEVDGRDITGMSATQAVLLIRGRRGTKVKLTVLRRGEREPLLFEIVRQLVQMPSVIARRLEAEDAPNVGYLQITVFGEDTTAQLEGSLKDLVQQEVEAIVLDLRNNPGGFLDTAVDVASQFIARGTIVTQRWSNGREQVYTAKPGGLATDTPVVVLINGGSASASEIVAGALRDTRRATLVGEKTFGKGSVQNVHKLSDGSQLRVTTAHWLTPGDRDIDDKGVEPDVEVGLGDVAPEQRDAADAASQLQLRRAIEQAQAKIAAMRSQRPGG
jgi:carboxyl-terminal processing protease